MGGKKKIKKKIVAKINAEIQGDNRYFLELSKEADEKKIDVGFLINKKEKQLMNELKNLLP